MLTDILTGPLRRKLYITFALIGLTLGAIQVGFASAQVGQPVWLTVAFAVFGFVATGFGFTAGANVPGSDGRHETLDTEAPDYDSPTTDGDEDQTTPEQRQPIPGTTLPGLRIEQ
ncbi:hypothetical protein ACSYDW_01410 [Paeniglutamicibacter sp. R2-26]|uniref:hypothetical protein n=1 Tax=Paeniglutamicibacter sp. R2-26 TaxID=3144417 RepID=UPI003EE751DC